MALTLVQKGKDCIEIARSTVNDLNHGNTEEAEAKLEILRQNGVELAEQAEGLSKRFKKVQEYNQKNEEETQQKIAQCGCKEQTLRDQKNDVEAKLAGQRSILEAKSSQLVEAKEALGRAERKRRAKEREANQVRTAATCVGILFGAITGGIGGVAVGAVVGHGIGQLINELKKDEEKAETEVNRRRFDCFHAESDIRVSEDQISSLQSEISSLVVQAQQMEQQRLQYHEKVGKMKEAIAFIGKAIYMWSLCKQVANDGVNRAGLLYKIVDKAASKANLGILHKNATQRVVGTFLEAWEEMETRTEEGGNLSMLKIDFVCVKCRQNCSDLPHVENSDAICNDCFHKHILQ